MRNHARKELERPLGPLWRLLGTTVAFGSVVVLYLFTSFPLLWRLVPRNKKEFYSMLGICIGLGCVLLTTLFLTFLD